MKTLTTLAVAAALALLALNLVESIRIRKALCGEYPVYRISYTLAEQSDPNEFDRNFANEEALELQGYRYVGSRKDGNRTEMDFVRIDRRDATLTDDEAEALREARLVKAQTR